MRLLIDTNVFLEILLEREKKEEASNFIRLSCVKYNQLIATSMSLRDIGYAVHRKYHETKKTKAIQLEVYQLVSKIVDTTADAAIESIYNDVGDYEDSMQMIAAEEAMCDAIITFNKKDYEKSKVPAFTPQEMIEIWEKQKRG